MVFDLDSTLLNTYGGQEGAAFNYHYQAHGYHPLLCFDGITGDLLKAELRDGTHYCSKDADQFMIPLLSGFSCKTKLVNANQLQLHVLAYNLFNWFRRLALAGKNEETPNRYSPP